MIQKEQLVNAARAKARRRGSSHGPWRDEKGEVRVEVKVCSTAAAEVKAKK